MKFRIEKLEDVTEGDRAKYQPAANGKGFTLVGIEGAVDKSDLDEFRNNNIKLAQDLEALKFTFAGVDLAAYKEVMETKQKEKEKKLIDAGKVEELFIERLAPVETKYKKEIADREAALAKTTKQLEVLLIDQGVTAAAIQAGARPEAIPDIINRARGISKVVEGQVQLVDGDKVLYSDDGRTPLDYKSWLTGVSTKPEYAHLFIPSTGGGADNKGKPFTPGAKTIARSRFEALDPVAKSQMMKDKIVVTDDA